MKSNNLALKVLLIVLLLCNKIEVQSCICLHPTIEEAYKANDEIFIGTAEVIDSVKKILIYADTIEYYLYTIKISAETKFKGGSSQTFLYQTDGNSCNLGRGFFEGTQKYLFYFNMESPSSNIIILSGCERNVSEKVNKYRRKHIKETAFKNDIKVLNELNPNPIYFSKPNAVNYYCRGLLLLIILISFYLILRKWIMVRDNV